MKFSHFDKDSIALLMPACQSGRHEAKGGTEWESWEQMAEWEPCVPNINNRQTEKGRLSPSVCVCMCLCVCVSHCPTAPGSFCLLQTISYFLSFGSNFLSSLRFTVYFSLWHTEFTHINPVQNITNAIKQQSKDALCTTTGIFIYLFNLYKIVLFFCFA